MFRINSPPNYLLMINIIRINQSTMNFLKQLKEKKEYGKSKII